MSERFATLLDSKFSTPRTGLVASGIGHALLVISLLITWPHLGRRGNGDVLPVIPVELVTIGDETNIAPVTRERFSDPEADVAQTPAVPTRPAEMAPTFEMKIFPQKPPPMRASGDASKDLDLDRHGHSALATSAPADARLGDYDVQGAGDRTASTLNILDALRSQIARCWVRPIGSTQVGTVITFQLFLNRDGSIAQPPALRPVDEHDGKSVPASQAEAIRRAIYTCAPYRLPSAKYDEWQKSIVVFDLQ